MNILRLIVLVGLLLGLAAPISAAGQRVAGAELVTSTATASDLTPQLVPQPVNKQEIDLFIKAVTAIEPWALKNIRAWNRVEGAENRYEALAALGFWKAAPLSAREYTALLLKLLYLRAVTAGEINLDELIKSKQTLESLAGSEFTPEDEKEAYRQQLAERIEQIKAAKAMPAQNLQVYRSNQAAIEAAFGRLESLSIPQLAMNKKLKRLKQLIALGGDPDARDEYGWTPLMYTAANNDSDMARYLMDAGANINLISKNGHSALALAADAQSLKIVTWLVSAAANPDIRETDLGYTALHYAASRGDKEIAKRLVHAGANVNIMDKNGETAMVLAAKKGQREIAELLRRAGTDPNRYSGEYQTPLESMLLQGNMEAARILVDIGVDMELRDPTSGATLLITSATIGEDKTAHALIEFGANVNAQDKKGDTALYWAAFRGNQELTRALLAAGAKPNLVTVDGWSPLMIAARRGNTEIARLLVAAGADTRLKNSKGDTALNLARKSGDKALIQILQGLVYLGCFRDQGNPWGTSGRDLSGYMEGSNAQTVERCVKICREKGFSYAGLQYESQCLCGNRYGSFGEADNCNMRCTGNREQICGGNWANSVYQSN